MDVIGNINLKSLQTFLVVADEGSFRLAAERLGRVHSAVSVQIRQLEDQLQIRLFERTTRSVRLTEEGARLREAMRRAHFEILHGLREIRETADLKAGRISLASSSHVASIHLPPILTEFVRDYPRIAVTIRELTSRELIEALTKQEVDFAIGPHVEDPAFTSIPVLVEPLHALVHPDFIDGPLRPVTWAEISAHPILLPAPQTAMRRIVDRVMQENGLQTPNRYQFIQAETIIAMAEAGLGIAIQPATRLEKLPPSRARTMELVDPHIRRAMSLITLRGAVLSPAAQQLADRMLQTIRAVTGYREGEPIFSG